jgi:hypothetical protein
MLPPRLECPLCERPASSQQSVFGDSETVTCIACGKFRISGTAIAMAKSRDPAERQQMLERAKRQVRHASDLPFVLS